MKRRDYIWQASFSPFHCVFVRETMDETRIFPKDSKHSQRFFWMDQHWLNSILLPINLGSHCVLLSHINSIFQFATPPDHRDNCDNFIWVTSTKRKTDVHTSHKSKSLWDPKVSQNMKVSLRFFRGDEGMYSCVASKSNPLLTWTHGIGVNNLSKIKIHTPQVWRKYK